MKIYLSLLVLATAPVFAKTYEEVREDFKETMYTCQENFGMGREEYFAFIEPKLIEAEKEIFAEQFEYVQKNPESKEAQQFLNAMLNYYMVSFNEYACSTDRVRDAKAYYKIKMQQALTALEKTKGSQADPSNPAMKANWGERFVDNANREYYNKLSIATKAKIVFGCLASKWS